MKFVATKTAEQLDLQALHRVRERLVSQRTGIINQIRAFMQKRLRSATLTCMRKGMSAWQACYRREAYELKLRSCKNAAYQTTTWPDVRGGSIA